MITTLDVFNSFQSTISGLEQGLQVIHIATPSAQLLCCQYDENIETVLARPDLEVFDQIPVKKREKIIGLLKRQMIPTSAKGIVLDYIQPLGEEILVSTDTSLLEFIKNDSLDRLVIGGTKIYGLVTKSDLLKLPVALLGFALVTHLEALMLNAIRMTDIREEEWLRWLNPRRKDEVRRHFARLTTNRSDPDMLELTYFPDKITILEKLDGSNEYAFQLPEKLSIAQLREVQELRNNIVHTGNTSDSDDILQKFIYRMRLVIECIEHIEHI